MFPKIGKYFKGADNKKVLDIGILSSNKADKDLLQNDNIEFYGVDKVKNCEIPDDWTEMFYIDLTEKDGFDKKLNKYFDAIIDYGVLGYPEVSNHFTENDFKNYINNILYILKDEGLYFFKVDLWGEHKKVRNLIYEHFKLTKFYDISNVKPGNDFETFVLRKKHI